MADSAREAAANGHVDVLRVLVKQCGREVLTAADTDGWTPAHWAALRGNGVFASIEVYREAERRRCQRMLREYLGKLDERTRARALRDCAQEFRDLRVQL